MLPSLVLSVVPVSVVSVDVSVLSVVSAQRATASQHGVTPEVAAFHDLRQAQASSMLDAGADILTDESTGS